MADTGNGATLTLGTTGAVGNIRNLGEITKELGKLDISHLGTTGDKRYMPDDLAEPGELEVEVEFDASLELPGVGTVETATVTYPLQSGAAYPATHAGTGFLTKVSTPQLANGQVQVGKLTFSFDGDTGPAFTKSSATTTTTTTTTT